LNYPTYDKKKMTCFGKNTWDMIALLVAKSVRSLLRSWVFETFEKTR